MKDNKIRKGRYIPYDVERDEIEEILNAPGDYICRFGVKLDDKGTRVLNSEYITVSNTQVLIKLSFFKGDLRLLEALEKLSREVADDTLRIAFHIVTCFLGDESDKDWDSMDYILINDLDSKDVNSKISKTK